MYTVYTYILPSNKCEIFHLNMFCFFLRCLPSPTPSVVSFLFSRELQRLCFFPKSPACGEGRGESDDLDCCKLRCACEVWVSQSGFFPMPNRMYGEYLINTYDFVWEVTLFFRILGFGKSSLGLGLICKSKKHTT